MVAATAGHIDHGKTALAGIDEDRLPEERSRGITVDPGLIDAPGHEWPMWTMLAGATGVAGQRCALNLVGVRLGKDGVADSGSRLDVRALEEPAFLGRLAALLVVTRRGTPAQGGAGGCTREGCHRD